MHKMKKIYLMIAALAIFMAGCESSVSDNVHITPECITIKGQNFTVITIDGCEYLHRTGNHSVTLTHKGNCKKCAERQEMLIRRMRQ